MIAPRKPRQPHSKDVKADALALLSSGTSPEKASQFLAVPVSTIRRWKHDPVLAEDSEVRSYVGAKMRELSVACSELAEDAAVAVQEFILSRDAKSAQQMSTALGILTDKATLLSAGLDAVKNVTPSTSERNPLLVPHKTTTQDNDV